ncbi:O-methyltransferas-like protein [Aspergillus sclerotiicarbonarius CBS 121057]|uniref:O-methyltransferas-like protein n=1 Tax=Aspergillus sclerotiicarbonarius (strain CBS 121057 / IBT 28362) TaxID=1448318 RepID=A0A319E867_ASPSB|nr:O-methyltransferas-like protein [Aspergillus sclerotiicarbonarius CBS 121057]
MESDIVRLASIVSSSTATLDRAMQEHGLRMPSFDAESPVQLTLLSEDMATARDTAINACMELLDHLKGPLTCLLPLYNGSSLQVISRYSIASHVPLSGEISYHDLSTACGVHVHDLKQVVRYAIVFHRLFAEQRKGYVSHSAGSRLIAQDPIVRAGMEQFDEFYGSCARAVDSMDQFQGHEPNETGFSLSHNTSEGLFEYLRSRPLKAKQFAEGIKFYKGPIPAYSPDLLVQGYPFHSLPEGAVVVDMGGSDGHVGRTIAQANPHVQVIVQDLPGVVEEAEAAGKARPGIQFQAHDIFTPQPVVAEVYLLRWILQDWPDDYVVRILRQLVSVLRKGARVVVNESLCPDSGSLPLATERYIRHMDLMMYAINKSRLRDEEEWQQLFHEADARFGTIRCWTPPGSALAIIEAVWEGE